MSENGKLSKFWLWELTRPAFEDWLDNDPAPVVVMGIGSIEQHGPHLPLGMDSLGARYFIHEVAKRSNSVAFHPVWPGYSPHHMAFRGTVTLSEDTLLNVIMDCIGSLSDHGVKRFVLTNHHGGNSNIFNLAIQMAKRYHGVMVTAPRGPNNTELAKTQSERSRRYWDVHSGVNETGGALHMFPELIEMWRIPEDWKPSLTLDPKLMETFDPTKDDYELMSQVRAASGQPDTDDFTADGIYGLNDPRDADPEEAGRRFEERAQFVSDFIKAWKTIPIPPAYRD